MDHIYVDTQLCCQEERDPDLLCGGQAGHYPAPLDEVGDDERVWVQIWGFSYPVLYDQDRERYVYGAADLAVAADVEGGGHVGHGHRVQQGDEGVGQHVKTRGRPSGQGQGQRDECDDQVEKDEKTLSIFTMHWKGVDEVIDDDHLMSEEN